MNKTKLAGYLLIIIGIGLPLSVLLNITFDKIENYNSLKNYIVSNSNIDNNKIIEIKKYNNSIYSEGLETIDPFGEKNIQENTIDKDEEIISYILIPKISIIEPIRINVTEHNLELGAVVVKGTSLPIGGENTRSVIAAHRSWYNSLRFFRINELVAGDRVYIRSKNNLLIYEVKNSEIISAENWKKLEIKRGEDIVTLLTCEPLVPPFNYRLLVNCYRVNSVTEDDKYNIEKINFDYTSVVTVILAVSEIFVIIKLFIYLFKQKL